MFKFFPDAEDNDKPDLNNSTPALDKVNQYQTLRPSEEVTIAQMHYDLSSQVPLTSAKKQNLKYIRVSELLHSPFVKSDPKVEMILKSMSDLLPGQYEGGFKMWECTFDLLDYLSVSNLHIDSNTNVLDLGCGHGLLGLFALSKGASVVFQDYNSEVLNFLTILNTIANFGDEGLSKSRYFSGSWGSFDDFIRQRGSDQTFNFDIILSSETIYNTDYLPEFISLVRTCLKPTGSLFLAAKTCYFGVGGGTKAFTSLIKGYSEFSTEIVKQIRDGIQREILHVKHLPA